MAETWTPMLVTATSREDPATFSPSPQKQWNTEPTTTTTTTSTTTTTTTTTLNSMLSLPGDSVTQQQTSPAQAVEAESQFDEQWTTTPSPSMATDTFQDSTNFAATTPLYKSRDDDNFTSQHELGRSTIFASSVVTATVSEIITETEAATPTTASSTAYDEFKLGLIVTLSVVIGCFAITAISLRIRSRIKKRRLESEIIKKRKKIAGNNTKPPVKRVTIKMGRDAICSWNTTNNKRPLRRSHSPSLQSRAKIPQIHIANSMDRNRTLDALLDAGTNPPLALIPLGLARDRAKSDISSKTVLLLASRVYEADEHAYDNPVISSAEEVTTEVSMLSEEPCPPLGMKINAEVHDGNKVTTRQNASDSEDGSVEKSNFIENSETESLSDGRKRFKLNQYFGMRSNQRNDSKDSGYVESFISQDSLRLRAMASLEEGRALTDGMSFIGGPERMLPRLGNIESAMYMASMDETSAHINMNRSSSVKSENDGFVHPKVWPDGSAAAKRQSRFSVPSFPTQYYNQRSRPPYQEMYGAPYVSYQTNMQTYPSSESSMYDDPLTQSDHGPVPRKFSHGTRVLPKSLSYESATYKRLDFPSPRTNQDYAPTKRAKRFVKHRSLGTQTCDADKDVNVQVQPIVQWDYTSAGHLVAKLRENAGMDFIGPIYMAEELDEMSFSDTDCVIEIEQGQHTSSV